MPRALPTPPFIERPVRAIIRDGLTFQRVQRLAQFSVSVDDGGNTIVLVRVKVWHFHTNANGTAGESASRLFPTYTLDYTTSNAEAIDPATGAVLLTQEARSWQDWMALIAADSRPLALRGDAYGWQLHQAQTGSMADLLDAAMDAADAPPYSRFKDSDD